MTRLIEKHLDGIVAPRQVVEPKQLLHRGRGSDLFPCASVVAAHIIVGVVKVIEMSGVNVHLPTLHRGRQLMYCPMVTVEREYDK